jgi:hypothetical protein
MGSKYFITVGVILIVAGLMLNYVRREAASTIPQPPLPTVPVSQTNIPCNRSAMISGAQVTASSSEGIIRYGCTTIKKK